MSTGATQPAVYEEYETPRRKKTYKEKMADARAKLKELDIAAKPAYAAEKTLMRKIMESRLFEWQPLPVLILTQLVALAMDEDSTYPEDAPDDFKADKVGWCWMSQWQLGLRCRCSEDNKPSQRVAEQVISDTPVPVTDQVSRLPAFRYLRKVEKLR
jgi:hypothetical protein